MNDISTTEILAIRLLDSSLRKTYRTSLQECYADWAITQLSLGYDSYYLNILAGIRELDNYFETDDYFLKALKELKINIPEKKVIVKNFVTEVCIKIINAQIKSYDGYYKLITVLQDEYDDIYFPLAQLIDLDDCFKYKPTESANREFDAKVIDIVNKFLSK